MFSQYFPHIVIVDKSRLLFNTKTYVLKLSIGAFTNAEMIPKALIYLFYLFHSISTHIVQSIGNYWEANAFDGTQNKFMRKK